MKALGIDLSTTATGLVILEENKTKLPTLLHEQSLSFPKLTGAARNREISTSIMMLTHEHMPDKIVIEGYSLNMKKSSSVIPLVEIGGLVRFLLHIDGLVWYDPTANQVKQFVTGKGNSPKEVMMMYVLKRWNHVSIDNNTADAYGCAALGLAINNRLPGITAEMRAIAGKLELRSA
jgi:Holliday junction resolvasome RuvABC endonuclease subunit